MAATATLVGAGHNHLRYLVVGDESGGTVTITTTGAASPDLNTDSLYGPIKQCSLAFVDGIGKLAAGAKTQAQSRAIWMAQDSDSVLGNGLVPRCLPRVTMRLGSGEPLVDADVDGSGHPTITVVAGADSEAYLDIETQGPIGL
jgi:hypothetical protein